MDNTSHSISARSSSETLASRESHPTTARSSTETLASREGDWKQGYDKKGEQYENQTSTTSSSSSSSSIIKVPSETPESNLDKGWWRCLAAKVSTEEPSTNPKHGWRRYISAIKFFLIDQYFLVGLCCLVLISSQVQVPARGQSEKTLVVTYLCVAMIFLSTGCTLPTKVLMENYAKWKIHIFVQVQCFLMCSAVTYGIVSICATNPDFMDPALLIGLIFTGCVPTTIASNVLMTKQARGNHVLTVVESTMGNLIGPILTPVLINMYIMSRPWYTAFLPLQNDSNYGQIYKRVFKQFGLSLFLPLAVGQALQNTFPTLTKKVFTEWKFSKLGSLALLVLIWQTFDQAFETGAFSSVKGSNMVFVVFIAIALYFAWMIICILLSLPWLPREDIVAVAYCVPAKTPAMGVPLSIVMFVGLSKIDQSKIQVPIVIFQGLQIGCGSLMTFVFRRWMDAGDRNDSAATSGDVEKGIKGQRDSEGTSRTVEKTISEEHS